MMIAKIPTDQIVMGVATALLCLWGIWNYRWLLVNTRKGEWLVNRFGQQKAIWLLCSLFLVGVLFGLLLAIDIIHPIQWKE